MVLWILDISTNILLLYILPTSEMNNLFNAFCIMRDPATR